MTEQRKYEIYKLFTTMYIDGYDRKQTAEEKSSEKSEKSTGSLKLELRHNPS